MLYSHQFHLSGDELQYCVLYTVLFVLYMCTLRQNKQSAIQVFGSSRGSAVSTWDTWYGACA